MIGLLQALPTLAAHLERVAVLLARLAAQRTAMRARIREVRGVPALDGADSADGGDRLDASKHAAEKTTDSNGWIVAIRPWLRRPAAAVEALTTAHNRFEDAEAAFRQGGA